MKIIFAGTPDFAAQALRVLLTETSHEVSMVLTQPDRPAGRGMKLTPSAVKQVALAHHIPIYQPQTLKTDAAQQRLFTTQADLMIVAAYGLILPQSILAIPHYGCLNIHASLLPRWRGAAPIQRAILAGDKETGITIMQMDAGLDTGDMLLSRPIPITLHDTAASLHDKLAICGAQTLVDTLADFHRYDAARQRQPDTGITYAEKLKKEEARIDWNLPAHTLAKQIRAFNPFPGSYAMYEEQTIKLWQATVIPETGRAGQILAADSQSITVACQASALSITRLQRPGSKQMDAASFLAGFPITPGQFFT